METLRKSLKKNLRFSKQNHSFSMPDSVLLCVLKRPDIGIHLGTIGLSREEKEEREKREPGIEKRRKAGKTWQKPCVLAQDQPKRLVFPAFSQLVHEKPVFF